MNELVTKTQKVNALAILLCDRPIMESLGIPTKESDEVIGRLISDLNNPFNFDDVQNMSIGEKIQKNFQICKAEDNFIDEALFHTLADAKESFVTKKATFEKRREVLE